MARWQYDVMLVPRAGVIRRCGGIPDEIPGCRTVWREGDAEDESSPDYWEGGPSPGSLEAGIGALLPAAESWCAEARMYGDGDGHRIEIWRCGGGIRFRYDVRDPDPGLLQAVLDLARWHDLLVVSETSGRPVEPSVGAVLADIRTTRAGDLLRTGEPPAEPPPGG